MIFVLMTLVAQENSLNVEAPTENAEMIDVEVMEKPSDSNDLMRTIDFDEGMLLYCC